MTKLFDGTTHLSEINILLHLTDAEIEIYINKDMWCHLSTSIKFRRSLRFVALVLLLVALNTTLFFATVSHAAAGTTRTISFQGRLQTAAGSVVADGHYNIQFKIYQGGAGTAVGNPDGTLKWTETYINNGGTSGVDVKNGFFSVNLGSVNPFGTSVDWDQDTLFLSMNVAGSATACTTFGTAPCAADGEMLPMKRITATPYAINAGAVGGKTVDQLIQNTPVLQANTNIALQSATDSDATAYIQGRTSQSAANLLIKQGSSQTGSALDIQASSGNSLFNIDSSGTLNQAGNANIGGKLGIGTAAPSRALDVAVNNSSVNSLPVRIAQGGTGDTGIELTATGSSKYSLGIDSSDGAFKIASSIAGGTTAKLGDASIGATNGSGNYNHIQAQKYVATDSGPILNMSVYLSFVDSFCPNIQMGIYADNGSGTSAGTLLGSSAKSPGAVGWTTQSLTTTVSLTSGTTYWLGLATECDDTTKLTSGVGTRVHMDGSTLPSTFASQASGSGRLSLYATIDTSGSAVDSFGGTASVFSLGPTGDATFRTSTNSSTALQLQNATGGSIFSIGTQGEPNNQIANGSIETDTSGWSARGSSTVSRTTSQHYSGGAALQVATTTAANDGAKYNVTLNSSTQYTVSINAKLLSGTFTNMSIGYSSNGSTETDCKTNQKLATNGWSVFNCTFTTGTVSGTPYFYVKQAGSGTARTFYLDAIHMVPGSNIGAYYEATLSTTAAVTSNFSIQSATDGQNSFQVQSSNGSTVLTTDTANQRVGIGLSAPKGALHVVSSTATDPTAIFQIGSGQTADMFQIRDVNQAVFTNIDKDANLTVKPTATSASTFPLQVQNSSGNNMLAVNTSATSGAPNVQVGARSGSGTPTLLTLDKTNAAPSVSNSSALVGSMYYDTTLGKVQCYEADGWGACGAAPDTFITISPEYTNAVMNGADIGTITSDLCSDTLNINDGSSAQPTICGTNETYNFYKWTSAETTDQTRSIFVTYQLPSNFKGFVAGSTSLMGRTNSSSSAVTYQIYRDHGGLTSCGTISVSSGSQTSWQKATASGASDPSTCGFVAGDSIFFRINVTAKNNAQAYISNLNFAFNNN
jgi:hypothetical protein